VVSRVSTRSSGATARLDGEGRGVLVGLAAVPATGAGWLDRFLLLPDEALALLRCRLRLSDTEA
jgi:hypothetical protein